MKRIFLVLLALFLLASVAFATSTRQKWTAGWDNFGEPPNYNKSHVTWSVNPTTSKLSVTFKLVGATPNKLYQVGVAIFCTTFPPTFGQFPNLTGGGTCPPNTRQGVTETTTGFLPFGVVTTDIYGNGSFAVVVGPIASGTYVLEFAARDGVLANGTCGGNSGIDFQSPGPTWGDATTITIP